MTNNTDNKIIDYKSKAEEIFKVVDLYKEQAIPEGYVYNASKKIEYPEINDGLSAEVWCHLVGADIFFSKIKNNRQPNTVVISINGCFLSAAQNFLKTVKQGKEVYDSFCLGKIESINKGVYLRNF